MKTLNELFNQPVKYKTQKQTNGQIYTFKVEDQKYLLNIYKNGTNERTFEIEFVNSTQKTAGVTGTGNAAVVFATVIDIIKKFVNTRKLETLVFSAKGKSRVDLYSVMALKIGKKLGYKLTKTIEGGETWFYLNKK